MEKAITEQYETLENLQGEAEKEKQALEDFLKRNAETRQYLEEKSDRRIEIFEKGKNREHVKSPGQKRK